MATNNKKNNKKERVIEPKIKKKKAITFIELTEKVKKTIENIEEHKIVTKFGKQYLVVVNEG